MAQSIAKDAAAQRRAMRDSAAMLSPLREGEEQSEPLLVEHASFHTVASDGGGDSPRGSPRTGGGGAAPKRSLAKSSWASFGSVSQHNSMHNMSLTALHTGVDFAAEDFGASLVRNAMTLLLCSRYGLTEVELLELLAPKTQDQLPGVVWARFFRGMERYITPPGGDDGSGLVAFFHRQMAEAVEERYVLCVRAHACACGSLCAHMLGPTLAGTSP